MKKTLILGAAMLAGTFGAVAQGTVNFADNTSTFFIRIYAPQTDTPGTEVHGDTSAEMTGSAAGTQTAYNGGLTGGSSAGTGLGNGNNVSVQLYAAAGSGVALSSLQPVSFYVGHINTKAAAPGLFVRTTAGTDPGIPGATSSATIAMYAWFNGGGTISLSQAMSSGIYGVSDVETITGLGGIGSPPGTPPDLNLQSFSLATATSVPEPSTIALGVMGASAFLIRRRMSKSK